jgi:chorismate mutase/prephenate dehydratase
MKTANLAIFGQTHSHTDEASYDFLQRKPDSKIIYYSNIFEVFAAIQNETAQYGIIPYENSTQGSVLETLDECFNHDDIKIIAAREKSIDQYLIGLPETSIETLQKIISHPQALAQSQTWCRKHCPKAQFQTEASTATAAKFIAEVQDPKKAAIGSKKLAQVFELEILSPKISSKDNHTKFICLQKTKIIPNNSHTSFVFWFSTDKSGSLAQVLMWLSDHQINLLKIDSRRAPQLFGGYLFFIDAEISLQNFEKVQKQLEIYTAGLKVLGSF